MGCVLCNIIKLSEKEEPFPSESARQDFMNELAVDIAQYHPDLVKKINEHARKMGMAKIPADSRIVDAHWFSPAGPGLLQLRRPDQGMAPAVEKLNPLVGLVITEDPVTKERRGFIGIGLGQDEKADMKYIAEWGSPAPMELLEFIVAQMKEATEATDGKRT